MASQFRKNMQVAPWTQAKTNTVHVRENTLVKDLMQFAGAAAPMVKNYMVERDNADARKQMQLIQENKRVTHDATEHGIRSAALLKTEMMRKNDLADAEVFLNTNPTDQEWADFMKSKEMGRRDVVEREFNSMVTDEQFNSVFEMGFIEDVAAFDDLRYKHKLKQFDMNNKKTFVDAVLNAETFPNFDKDALKYAKAMNISEEDAVNLAMETAIASGDSKVIDMVSKLKYNGHELGKQNPNLEVAYTKAAQKAAESRMAELAVEEVEMTDKYLSGAITKERFSQWYAAMHKETAGYASSSAELETILGSKMKAMDKTLEDELHMEQVKSIVAYPSFRNTTDLKASDMEAAMTSVMMDMRDKYPEDPYRGVTEALKLFGNKGLTSAVLKDMLISSPMEDIDLHLTETDGVLTLSPEMEDKLMMFESIPLEQRQNYLGGKNDKFFNSYSLNRKSGMSVAMAAKQAQIDKFSYTDTGAVFDASDTIIDNVFTGFGVTDVETSQRPYLMSKIQPLLKQYPTMGDATIREVEEQVKANFTTVTHDIKWLEGREDAADIFSDVDVMDKGLVLAINPNTLLQQIGLNNGDTQQAYQLIVDSFNNDPVTRKKIESIALNGGFHPSEVIYDFVQGRNGVYSVNLVHPNGRPLGIMPKSLPDIGKVLF